jgi:predicted DNA-binding transcriptional regulator AlpA
MPRQTALPPSLAPRLVSRESAAYICVSPNTFDEMVKNGQMPRARLLGERRRAWDVRQLDIAIDELPSDGDNSLLDNDEHAAKRVSDAFDTATELRDEELGGALSFGLARPSDGERNEKPDRSAHMRITVRLLASLNHVELRQ